ncbi:MAG: NAD-dependent epimerase/dehydratase family protein, partial [Chthoniobacterales bacterium]|nr:NAD-dependent epimerase/dehydratase family protein [Chthoniobacterales bacterium]
MELRKSDKIFVAGHQGMVGSALMRRLHADGFTNVVTRLRSELD